MILRLRTRLFHSTQTRPLKNLRNPNLRKPFEQSRFHLSPQIVASTLTNCPSDSIAMSFFLWCARQPNYFHDPDSFDRMIPIARRLSDQFQTVARIVEELESVGCPRKMQTFLILLRIYWRANMHDLAFEVFGEMTNQNFIPNTFARNVILDILFKIGDFDMGIRFFKEIRYPNYLSFNIVLRNLCMLGDWLGVKEVLREMVNKGFYLNIGSFSVALDCFKKTGRSRELVQLLAFLIVSGHCPSVEVWTILIDGLCRVGEVDLACEMMKKMVDSGYQPNVVTYTLLIRALFDAQMSNKVVDVWNCMLSKGCEPDLVLYNVLIDFFSKQRRYDVAINIFRSMTDKKIRPDLYTLSSIMPTLCYYGKLRYLLEEIARPDVSMDLVAWNSLLNALCKAGFPSEAVKSYKCMIERGFSPDPYSYVALLSSLCKLGKIEWAVNFYRGLVESNHRIDPYIHSAIFDGLVKRGVYHAVFKLIREAVSKNYCLDVVPYTIAIDVLLTCGRFEEACGLFDRMKKIGVIPNVCTYNVMLRRISSSGDINLVKQVLRNMKIDGIDIDNISFHVVIRLSNP